MVSPPKPWERGYVKNNSIPNSTSSLDSVTTATMENDTTTSTAINNDSTLSSSKTDAPALPPRPSTSSIARTGFDNGYDSTYTNGYSSTYGGYGNSYGYGGYGGMSSYSPYSRFGSYGSYGSYGGYGSGYSPYSSYSSYGLGGYNRLGYGGYPGVGGMMGNNNEFSLMRQMEESTQSTFQTIGSIVQAFGGFAQMLDSTFCATHSSFMAMVGVADQLSHLKGYLGEVLSLFNIVKYIKRWLGLEKSDSSKINASEFEMFSKNPAASAATSELSLINKPKSRKPLYIFAMFLFGFPYLMSKLINLLKKRQLQQMERQGNLLTVPGGRNGMITNLDSATSTTATTNNTLNANSSLASFPRSADGKPIIEFARCLYDFTSQNPIELSLKKGDIIAIISKLDPQGQPCQWWKGRLQQGNTGIFPSNYVELIPTKQQNNNKTEKKESNTEKAIDEKSI